MQYIKPERILLKSHPELSEKWVQNLLEEDPSLLGLGNLELLHKEKKQPQGGRLDLLFANPDTGQRYEVEIQLGKTDESHIIRTIEYWDTERKRYPRYEHTAVIVAEDITSRFFNVISLFNRSIPLVAIQMQAFKFGEQGDHVSLVFTTVLDERSLSPVEEDEVFEPTNRDYWEKRGSKATLEMTDSMFAMIQAWDSELELKYNKFYIGLAKQGQPNNFVTFRPKKDFLRIEVRLMQSEETEAILDQSGLELMDYDSRHGCYRIRLSKADIKKHEQFLQEFLESAYDEAMK